MIQHTITVADRTITSIEPRRFVQNGIDADEIVLVLDDEWSEVSTILVTFKNSAITNPVSLIYSGDPIKVPKRILSEIGSLTISVTGYGDDMKRVITEAMTSTSVIGNITASGIVPEFWSTPEESSPDVFAQLIQQIEDIRKRVEEVEGGEFDYSSLKNKPSIETVELVGNKTFAELGAKPISDDDISQIIGD